jgi:hypothetical protein
MNLEPFVEIKTATIFRKNTPSASPQNRYFSSAFEQEFYAQKGR